MPGSITYNVPDSILHYDFRFLPIELENMHILLIPPKFIQSVFKCISRVLVLAEIGCLNTHI